MTITQPLRTRRTHSEAFKQSLIEACGEPGASVAGVALANGINANPLRRWMRERGALKTGAVCSSAARTDLCGMLIPAVHHCGCLLQS